MQNGPRHDSRVLCNNILDEPRYANLGFICEMDLDMILGLYACVMT